MTDDPRTWVGEDVDPLNDRCDACGAEVAEDCRPGCLGKAAHEDALEGNIVLGRTTGGSPRVVIPRKK